MALGTTACSGDTTAADSAGTTTSQDSTTEATTIDETSDSAMTSTETDTDDGPDDTTLTAGSFYAGPDDFPLDGACDPWMQDCPEGEKCVPYASTGGSWDANKCVPILGDGQTGDPCSYGGLIEATDTCDASNVCWDVTEIDGELVGTCTQFCTGTPDQPQCPDEAPCVIANEGSITLCMQACDPLMQDCPEGYACQWVNELFACIFGAEEQPAGAPCDGLADCPSGYACVQGQLVPDCAGSACCTAFCSISEPDCVEPTSECVPLLDDPPPGYEDVGVCVGP